MENLHISDNELASFSKDYCFLLGSQVGALAELLKQGGKLECLIYTANSLRVKEMLIRRHRHFATVERPDGFTLLTVTEQNV